MKNGKPTVSFGSIFPRGKRGTFSFESKAHGIRTTSLKTNDPAEAEQEAIKRFGYLQLESETDRLETLTATLTATSAKAKDAKRPRLPFNEKRIWSEYLAVLKRTGGKRNLHEDASNKVPLALTTLASTKTILKRFVAWVDANCNGVVNMDDITPTIADRFFDHIRDTLTANSFNRYRVNLHVIWSRLALKASTQDNPFDAIQTLSKGVVDREKSSKQPFSIDELTIIFDTAEGWILSASHLGYETALRLGDIVTLKKSELDLDGNFITKTTRKGVKSQQFYIPESAPFLAEWLKTVDADSEYVFPRHASAYLGIGRKKDRTRASKEFQRFLTKIQEQGGCGINAKDDNGKTVKGFHSFRVSNATFSRTNGKSVADVQSQLGHSSAVTTDGYIQEDSEAVRTRLRAEYKPLPLEKVSRLTLVKKVVAELSAEEASELQKWLSELLAV